MGICSSLETVGIVHKQLPQADFTRLISLTEGCVPLHLAKKGADVNVRIASVDGKLKYAPLPANILERARQIAQLENHKLRSAGITEEWLDGDKTAVSGLDIGENHIAIAVSLIRWSSILAMHDLSFEEIAGHGGLCLGTNTHLTALDHGRNVLVIGERGKRPGEARMGQEVYAADANGATQLTLAVNGGVDAEILSAEQYSIWRINSAKELAEELGMVIEKLRYLGIIVDKKLFKGDIGILGLMNSELEVSQIERLRRSAMHSVEVGELTVIPLEMREIAKCLRENRAKMTPQLVVGILILGYQMWGSNFLKCADK